MCTLCLYVRSSVCVRGDMCVCVQVNGVPWSERNKHKGKDSGILTRAFNVSGNVRRRIYHVHGSHPGGDK